MNIIANLSNVPHPRSTESAKTVIFLRNICSVQLIFEYFLDHDPEETSKEYFGIQLPIVKLPLYETVVIF